MAPYFPPGPLLTPVAIAPQDYNLASGERVDLVGWGSTAVSVYVLTYSTAQTITISQWNIVQLLLKVNPNRLNQCW